MNELMEKWKELCRKANEKGIPVPMVRDPKTMKGSVSLTLVFISFNVWLASVVGKVSGAFGGIDMDASLNMFIACAGLYWGRKLTKDGNQVQLGEDDEVVQEDGESMGVDEGHPQ